MNDPERLARNIPTGRRLPPVEVWRPAQRGEIDIRIDRDGVWYHAGEVIRRAPLWRLFSTILRRDPDDEYYLVTPVEQLRIRVEDVPFLIVALQVADAGHKPRFVFTSNCGDRVPLDCEHPLRVQDDGHGGVTPYLRVRARLDGRLTRAVYYQLAEYAEQCDGVYGIRSGDGFFALAPLAA